MLVLSPAKHPDACVWRTDRHGQLQSSYDFAQPTQSRGSAKTLSATPSFFSAAIAFAGIKHPMPREIEVSENKSGCEYHRCIGCLVDVTDSHAHGCNDEKIET